MVDEDHPSGGNTVFWVFVGFFFLFLPFFLLLPLNLRTESLTTSGLVTTSPSLFSTRHLFLHRFQPEYFLVHLWESQFLNYPLNLNLQAPGFFLPPSP